MAYKITFRRGKRESFTKLWPCDLEAATHRLQVL